MGKGDKKSKRGKIIIGSHGVRRAKKRKGIRKSSVAAALLKERKVKPVEPVVKEIIVEQPLIEKEEKVAEIAPAEELTPKKAPKKSVSKKAVEQDETGTSSAPKAKAPKAKKKPESTGEDLFTKKEE